MDALKAAVGDLAMREMVWAQHLHGQMYASDHEGYGVLSEEVQEAKEEQMRLDNRMHAMLRHIHQENREKIKGTLLRMEQDAINGACENIQVAAVCRKWLEGMQ